MRYYFKQRTLQHHISHSSIRFLRTYFGCSSHFHQICQDCSCPYHDRLNLTQGVQVILKMKSMKSMNLKKIYDIYESKKKIYEIYEYFRPSKARFHILQEARRADNERASKGLNET